MLQKYGLRFYRLLFFMVSDFSAAMDSQDTLSIVSVPSLVSVSMVNSSEVTLSKKKLNNSQPKHQKFNNLIDLPTFCDQLHEK